MEGSHDARRLHRQVAGGFTLDALADAAVRDTLKWAMSELGRLRPGESRQALTERAAAAFASLAQALCERGLNTPEWLAVPLIRKAILHVF